ncbi:MAG: SHOCT domain-containing protein [Ktedonobacteraceae bacterium]
MGYHQNTPPRYRRRSPLWVRWLFPLALLLIFVYMPSLMSLFVSVAIIVLLWGLIAAASARARQWTPPPVQQLPLQPPVPLYTPPEPETPYEQGYTGVALPPQQPQQHQAEEDERLAQLTLIGDLYHAGTLTEEEFEQQKQRILRADAVRSGLTKEATEAEATSSEEQYEEQPQAQYEQVPLQQQ